MTYLINNNHTLLIALILIGSYKVLSFAIDIYRALPLMYYCGRVTAECPDADIQPGHNLGFFVSYWQGGNKVEWGETPAEAWRNAWLAIKKNKTSSTTFPT